MVKKASHKLSLLKHLSRRTALLAALAVLLVAGGLILALGHGHNTRPATGTTADGKKVNLSPATSQDQQNSDSHKNSSAQQDQPAKNIPSTDKATQASLVITSADQNSVRAYVNGVFEEGGTCTATATQGSQVITASSAGFENVSYTQCTPINWPSALGGGTWVIKVSYSSSGTQVSATKTIQV
jgi:hypothetical protein